MGFFSQDNKSKKTAEQYIYYNVVMVINLRIHIRRDVHKSAPSMPVVVTVLRMLHPPALRGDGSTAKQFLIPAKRINLRTAAGATTPLPSTAGNRCTIACPHCPVTCNLERVLHTCDGK
jgi:hypothetical protein